MFSLPGMAGGHLDHEKGHSSGNETVASDWVTAGYTGKDASIKITVDSVKKIIVTSVDKSKLDALFQKNLDETKQELKKINS